MVPTLDKAATATTTTMEEASLSDSGSDEKTIPFLRRLRDMLRENEGTISFIPGHRPANGKVVLGRLVVHDRIEVEATVLPRYFNHSSFASLRRQLNYFSFVRLGKGRQRESTYINDGVVELDDILALRRRSTGGGGTSTPNTHQEQPSSSTLIQPKKEKAILPSSSLVTNKKMYVDSIVPVVHLPSLIPRTTTTAPNTLSTSGKRARRVSGNNHSHKKHAKKQKTSLPSLPSRHHHTAFVSEDEESHVKQKQVYPSVALDLTQASSSPTSMTTTTTDPELLEGCTALLGLSGKLWG